MKVKAVFDRFSFEFVPWQWFSCWEPEPIWTRILHKHTLHTHTHSVCYLSAYTCLVASINMSCGAVFCGPAVCFGRSRSRGPSSALCVSNFWLYSQRTMFSASLTTGVNHKLRFSLTLRRWTRFLLWSLRTLSLPKWLFSISICYFFFLKCWFNVIYWNSVVELVQLLRGRKKVL